MNFSIKTYEACDLLKPYVQTYWHGQFNLDNSPLFTQKVMPNGYIELIFHLSSRHCFLYQNNTWTQSPGFTLIGLFTKPYEVHFDGRVQTFGIRFKPEGIYNLFGVPASEFSENYLDLTCVFSKSFRYFAEKIQEQRDVDTMCQLTDIYLLGNLRQSSINYYYLNRAAEMIRQTNGLLKMEDLTTQVFISKRQLEREFKEKIGISPKHYTRIVRLNKVNDLLLNDGKPDLSAITYESGFADQAHFIREFRHFSGLPPSKFLKTKYHYIVNL
jgi:AraC-like DNA-binding protein